MLGFVYSLFSFIEVINLDAKFELLSLLVDILDMVLCLKHIKTKLTLYGRNWNNQTENTFTCPAFEKMLYKSSIFVKKKKKSYAWNHPIKITLFTVSRTFYDSSFWFLGNDRTHWHAKNLLPIPCTTWFHLICY